MSNAYFSVRRLISLKLQVLIFDGGITMLMSYVEFRATHLAGHIFLPYLTCGWINSACNRQYDTLRESDRLQYIPSSIKVASFQLKIRKEINIDHNKHTWHWSELDNALLNVRIRNISKRMLYFKLRQIMMQILLSKTFYLSALKQMTDICNINHLSVANRRLSLSFD